jgi:hypothetical protein
MRAWFPMSEKGMVGIMAEPVLEMWFISERREERRRHQEEMRADSWGWIREDFRVAKRGGRGVAWGFEREAKTEEMSPSGLPL